MAPFFLYLAGLVIPGLWLGYKRHFPIGFAVGASFLIFEAGVIWGSGLLSAFNLLGTGGAYQLVTVLAAVATAACLWLLDSRDRTWQQALAYDASAPHSPGPISSENSPFHTALSTFSATCLILFGIIMLFIALNADISVEDALTIKLPKAVFYTQAGNFLPTNFTEDGRMYIAPPYSALLHVFFIVSENLNHSIILFSWVNWIINGLAIYHTSRDLGALKAPSLVAVALVLLSPILIIQGSSEGDDIIAATPFVVGMMFATSFAVKGRLAYAVLAGLGFGLSVGLKLFAALYLPAVILIALIVLASYSFHSIKSFFASRGLGIVILAIASVAILLPHFVANILAYGNPLYVSRAVASTTNSPFDFSCATASLVAYLKQFFLSDLARIFASPPAGSVIVSNFNSFFNTYFAWDIPGQCIAYSEPYLITYPAISENTLWFGLFGPIIFLSSLVVCLNYRHSLGVLSLAIGLIFWIITYSVTQKYIAGIGRYWTLAVLTSSPVVAFLIDRLLRGAAQSLKWKAMPLFAVMVITVILGWRVVTENQYRALPSLMTSEPKLVQYYPPDFREVIGKAPSLNVVIHYGAATYDYYLMMHRGATLWNKAAPMEDAVNVAVVRPYGIADNPFSDARIPVRMEKPFQGGFRYMGTVSQGLGFANNIELEGGGQDQKEFFLLFQVHNLKQDGGLTATMRHIAQPGVLTHMRYKVGWRSESGPPSMPDVWSQGLYTDFTVPAMATKLVIQAVSEDGTNKGSFEWPIKAFAGELMERLQ